MPKVGRLRSQYWFDDLEHPDASAIHNEPFAKIGMSRGELKSGRPIIGIAQSGSDIAPCNIVHVNLAKRVSEGIRDAGGIALEFPVHPLQETLRRPTAALDRNLAYLGLVEMLTGYPFDGVVLTTGCDKTVPASLMAAATVDLPAIVLSGGPMLNGWTEGQRAGSGMAVWESRRKVAAGELTSDQLIDRVMDSTPSLGHCNTMGTALSMNSLAEALGMSLPGCAAIPAPYAARSKIAYETGRRIVEMVHEDIRPSQILTREAFENAIRVNSAIGGSTNCPVHINAIAAHAGVTLTIEDWDRIGHDVHLVANVQPCGDYLGEEFYRAGGVPAVIGELLAHGLLHGAAATVSGVTLQAAYGDAGSLDHAVIRPYDQPVKRNAGFAVLHGNLFDSAVMKTSVISQDFRARYLSSPGKEDCFVVRAVVFEGPEDYRERINDPSLEIDESCILVIRNVGPIGYPGAAEVVNMTPPRSVVQRGVEMLPCMGDGRQSGTSDSPSILNVSPESAVGGRLALLKTGDLICINIKERRLDVLWTDEELKRRKSAYKPPVHVSHTPWEELYRSHVTQLGEGAYLDIATKYRQTGAVIPRHSH